MTNTQRLAAALAFAAGFGGGAAVASSGSYGPPEPDMLVIDFSRCAGGACSATLRKSREPTDEARAEGITDTLRINVDVTVDEVAALALLPSE